MSLVTYTVAKYIVALWIISLIRQSSAVDIVNVDPSIKMKYIFNNQESSATTTFQWTKWGGHHAISEVNDNQRDKLLNLGAFANRWLKPDAAYFHKIPAIPRTNKPNLTWFDNTANQELVASSWQKYIDQYGANQPKSMILCIQGCTWPSYMVGSNKNATCDKSAKRNIPTDLAAAASIIIKSLKVLQQKTSQVPRYFEPQNEPFSQKFGTNVSVEERIDFQNYINRAVYNKFRDKMVVGGNAMAGLSWMKDTKKGSIFDQFFGRFISKAKTKYPVGFISWHYFSKFAPVGGKFVPDFRGSGALSATFDLIESYTNSVNNYKGARKIIVSEHGYATEENLDHFNTSYMQWIAVTQYLTNIMLFLERPESQLEANTFFLTGKFSTNNNYPNVILDFNTEKVTLTGMAYRVNKLLKDNGGYIMRSIVQQNGNQNRDRVKSFAVYNAVTEKAVIVIKEISWKGTNLDFNVKGLWKNRAKKVKALRIYWNSGKVGYKEAILNINKNIWLHPGGALVLYDVPIPKRIASKNAKTVCRRRYYSVDFSVKSQALSMTDTLNINKNQLTGMSDGVLRIGFSWSIPDDGYTTWMKLQPDTVKIDGNNLDLRLNRIDNLVQNPNGMTWASFEYTIKSKDINKTKNWHKVEIEFDDDSMTTAVVTSVVAEIYTVCGSGAFSIEEEDSNDFGAVSNISVIIAVCCCLILGLCIGVVYYRKKNKKMEQELREAEIVLDNEEMQENIEPIEETEIEVEVETMMDE